MGYAIFSIVTGVITVVCMLVVSKGKLNIVAGYNTLTEEQKKKIDKHNLIAYVLRILLTVTIIQFTTGIVCFFRINGAILITEISFLILSCLLGVILHSFSEKKVTKNNSRIHKICTLVIGCVAPITICCIAFC